MARRLDPDDPMWPEPFDPSLPAAFNERLAVERAMVGKQLRYSHVDLDHGIIVEAPAHGVEFRTRIDDVARAVVQGGVELVDLRNRAGGVLLVMAWEATVGLKIRNPSWEFLRHCRNAVAHGGAWTFKGKEPRRETQWRGIQVERSMQGTPLFRLPGKPGSLDDGDPILLLWDLETSTPQIPARATS